MDKKQLIDIVSTCIIGTMSETGTRPNGTFVTEQSIQKGMTTELTNIICPNSMPTEEMQDMVNSLVDHIMAIRVGREISKQ